LILLILSLSWDNSTLLGGKIWTQPSSGSELLEHPAPFSLIVTYAPPSNRLNQDQRDWLKHFGIFEQLETVFNQQFQLETPLHLLFQDCGIAQITSQPGLAQVTLCYELLDYLSRLFDDYSASLYEQQLAAADVAYVITLQHLAPLLWSQLQLQIPEFFRPYLDSPLLVILPLLLESSSADVILSGLLWMHHHGQPLPGLQRLPGITDWHQAEYEYLICLAYGSQPQRAPYLRAEWEAVTIPLPQASQCVQQWHHALETWTPPMLELLQPS
jgi:hypothetical protein